MRKSKLVFRFLLLLLVFGVSVNNPSASSSPFWYVLNISVADLHSLIVKTSAFCKSFDNEVCFSPYTLYAEVEPAWCSVGIRLFFEFDLISARPCHCYAAEVSALEVTSECGVVNFNYFAQRCLYAFYILVDVPESGSIDDFPLCNY